MFHTKNHKQLNIFDPWEHLGPKRRKILDKSWSGLFRREILPELPVDALREYYHDSMGRPTKELFSMVGLMILQQMHDLTDEQAVEQFCFNVQWHYALDITDISDASSYVSLRSLWTMRNRLTEKGLHKVLFDKVAQKLAKVFKVDFSKQRIDSVHIQSNMRHLGRIGLFVNTIKKFLMNLKRHHRHLLDVLDKEMRTRYLKKKKEAVFALVKPTQAHATLDQLASDIFFLVERFSSVEGVNEMSSFKLLVRLYQEQCIVEDRDGERIPVAKPNKDVPSDSLQNPSDPDAGYSGHKGQGFQVQVMETYHTDSEDSLSLITHIEVEPAHHSDANALLPAIERVKENHMAPEELLADSLYGGDDNCERAKNEHDVEVVSPVMGKTGKGLSLDDFTLDASGKIVACPTGHTPVRVRPKKRFSAAFNLNDCRACPQQELCPVKLGKKAAYLRYSKKEVRLSRRRIHEQTTEFRDKYRFRAGVEATMSEYDRRTGVKKLRVRGLKAVSYAAIMKAIGLNIRRAVATKMWQKAAEMPCFGQICVLICLIVHLTEQISAQFDKFASWIRQNRSDLPADLKLAA
jgi:IS5 family transposase